MSPLEFNLNTQHGVTAELRLNTSTLSSPNSLTIQLTSDLIPSVTIATLVDFGSTYCFIDTTFVSRQQLQTLSITLIPLRLFDKTTNTVICNTVKLPICFTSGEIQSITFYITPLDVSCSAVLRHSWLTHYNPLIDWVLGSISFHPPKETESLVPPELATPASGTPNSTTNISLIGVAVFTQASRLADVQVFKLFVSTMDPRDSDTTPVDMSNVLSEYYEFHDVFSKSCANTLPTHQPYDLKIELEDRVTAPFSSIYSLSPYELQMLVEFIDKHLICWTHSLSRALVLHQEEGWLITAMCRLPRS